MRIIFYLFWISLGIIFYSYFGYAIVLLILTGIKQLFSKRLPKPAEIKQDAQSFPNVTIVVAAYNEQSIIKQKIDNCLNLNYPPDKLSCLFITDGSTDRTPEIIKRHPQIRLLHQPDRKGKSAALNRAMIHVNTPITVFCDANTMLNKSAIKRLVSHYQDPTTGGVSGEKRISLRKDSGVAATGEGLYWKYESFVKQLDAELYTVTGAAGELFSIRTDLWEELPENIILDDFLISTRINLRGYRIAYEPAAYASELPSTSIHEEKKRKIRISAGAFQAMVLLKPLFNIFRHPILFFQFLSHRILRWTLTPICLPILFITNIVILLSSRNQFFLYFLLAQVIFYGMGVIGVYSKSSAIYSKIFRICYYLLFMNYSVYLGFFRFIRGRQSAIWEKAGREVVAISPERNCFIINDSNS